MRLVKSFLSGAFLLLLGCTKVLDADELEYTLEPDGGSDVSRACTGTEGPLPVNIDGKFCIDSTEVTNAHYQKFLDAPEHPEQPAECAENVLADGRGSYEPRDGWSPNDIVRNRPVEYVDWCDARAYCQWAGKRLCGNVADGGPGDFDDYNSVRTEYFYACSHNGERAFPYGDEFDPDACVSVNRSRTYDVASFPGCEGPYPGVFDLSGNVSEWQNLCTDTVERRCRIGAAGFASDDWRCDRDIWGERANSTFGLGIRCCSDAL